MNVRKCDTLLRRLRPRQGSSNAFSVWGRGDSTAIKSPLNNFLGCSLCSLSCVFRFRRSANNHDATRLKEKRQSRDGSRVALRSSLSHVVPSARARMTNWLLSPIFCRVIDGIDVDGNTGFAFSVIEKRANLCANSLNSLSGTTNKCPAYEVPSVEALMCHTRCILYVRHRLRMIEWSNLVCLHIAGRTSTLACKSAKCVDDYPLNDQVILRVLIGSGSRTQWCMLLHSPCTTEHVCSISFTFADEIRHNCQRQLPNHMTALGKAMCSTEVKWTSIVKVSAPQVMSSCTGRKIHMHTCYGRIF